jgi:hypothetical protein
LKVSRRFGGTSCESADLKSKQSKEQIWNRKQQENGVKQAAGNTGNSLLSAGFLHGLLFNPEDGDDMFLLNVA